MATVNKDFKIKSGLVVEGTTGTINGLDILTKKQADQDYIVNLIGGTATSENTPNTVVKRDADGNFAAGTITADITGQVSDISNHDTGDLAEGTNLYFTNQRAIDAGDGVFDGFGAAATAETNANLYTDNAIGDLGGSGTASIDGQIDVLTGTGIQVNGGNNSVEIDRQTVDTWYDASGSAAQALSDANDYTDTAVANVVGAAPELLDTLNELAAALQDNPDIIADLQDVAAGKQDTLTAGANIDITGATISVTGLDSADISDFSTAAVTANTGLWDTVGAAATAEQNAIAHADALDTDDIAEGVAQYFTDARAKDSAVNLLVNSTQENIDISWTLAGGLVIAAENGVAGSTTDDLTEGEDNLYFTGERVFNTISSQNIQPGSIDITWVRREEATWTNVPTASKATCHSAGTQEGSMKYLVRVTASVGGTRHSHVTEVLATVDGANGVAVVEYGTIYTSAEPLATVTVEWNSVSSEYDLNVTTANNNSEVMVAATLMATLD